MTARCSRPWLMGRALALLASLAVFFCPRRAHSQDFTHHRFTLPRGGFEIGGEPARPKIMGIDLSRDRVGQPTYIAPHFYWGVSDRVTIGVTHQRGLCLSGPNGGCAGTYNDAGFGMLVGLIQNRSVELDLHVGVPVSSFSPFTVGVKTGALARINGGHLAFVFDPYVYVGLSRRSYGNRENISLPFWLYIQATRLVVPFFGVELAGPLDAFGPRHVIATEGGVIFDVTDDVDLGVMLRFPDLLGPAGSADARELGLIGRFRF